MDLLELKKDKSALLEALGLERDGPHCRCPFHGDDKNGSLSVWCADGIWLFKCHTCLQKGTVIDALAAREKTSPAEIIRGLQKQGPGGPCIQPPAARPKPSPRPPTEPIPPVPDAEKLRRFRERAQETLYSSEELQRRWLVKRGIPLATAQRYGLGFMPWIRFEGWKHSLADCWVIPVSAPDGRVLALKLHRENPKFGPKSMWAPLGTEPASDPARGTRPRHGWSTFFPAPEWGCRKKRLFLCPGELKALAVAGAGLQATAPTAGESARWTPGAIARFAGFNVVIVFDDDSAGHSFRDGAVAALAGTAATVKIITFGTAGVASVATGSAND